MSTFGNFTLGGAGVLDLLTRADDAIGLDLIPNSNLAASTYAKQAAEGGATYSKTLDAARTSGAGAAVIQDRALTAGLTATKEGALGTAAKRTVDQVVKKIDNAIPDLGSWKWIIGGAAVAAVLVAGIVYLPKS